MMESFSFLDEICGMLNTYGGRDKVMKALCYSAKFVSGLNAKRNPDFSKKCSIFSSKISQARATLRLVDDIPMLQYCLKYGLGKQEHDKVMSLLGLVANIVDQIYYPIEKVCWLIEHKLLNVEDPDKWDFISSVFWIASIYLNLMRTLRNFKIMEQHKHCLDRRKSEEIFLNLIKQQKMEAISILRLSLDLTHAVSTLPKGYLWGNRLETWQVGLIGTSSAFLGIYQFLAKKRMTK